MIRGICDDVMGPMVFKTVQSRAQGRNKITVQDPEKGLDYSPGPRGGVRLQSRAQGRG